MPPPKVGELQWVYKQCQFDANEHITTFPPCRIVPPAKALIVWPVSDFARGYWASKSLRIQERPFVGDLLMAIGSDESDPYTFFSPREVESTGLKGSAAWQRAFANVDRYGRIAYIRRYSDGTHWVSGNGISAAALVFADSLWKREEFRQFKGPPAVALDSRDHFFVADSADPTAVHRLHEYLTTVHCAERNYPDFCSRASHVFVRSERGKWQVLE